MKNTIGVKFSNDASGKIKSVTIDLLKHGKDLQPFFEKVGAISNEDDFEKKWAEGITGDELIQRVNSHLKTLPWKK